jgi:3-carboxy-cis,cis-muconate cycloisomerase
VTFSALDSRLLGPLFATDPMRAAFADEARLAHMIAVEAALARAQGRLGLVPLALAEAIAAVTPADLDLDALGAATAVAGVPVIPFVKAMQGRLPTALEPHFHKGATTQDVMDTALVLAMRDGFDLIAAELAAILSALARLAREHRATPCVGRTYGQHAAPITFGFKAAVWLSGIADAAAALPALRERVLVASLGGPVGTLAGLKEHGPAVLEAFAAELGLNAPPLAWHANRSRIAAAGAWLAALIGALAKMAGDVAHLASTEVGEVAEPHVPGRGGSSAMPHKRNPVGATVIFAAHGAAASLVVPLLQGQAAQHERPAGAWHGEWHALPPLFGVASGALREARSLAEGLQVDPERMRENLDLTRGLLFADAVAARLAPRLGREAAHHLVEAAAGRVRAGEGSLREVLARDAAVEPGDSVEAPFDLTPAIAAASPWIDRVIAAAEDARAALLTPETSPHAPA